MGGITHDQDQAQNRQPRSVAERELIRDRAAADLAELINKELDNCLDGKMDVTSMRGLIERKWHRVQTLAHIIHGTYE